MSAFETTLYGDRPTFTETGTIWTHPAVGRAYTRVTLLDDLGLHVFTSASSRYASTLVVALDEDGDPMLWDNDRCHRFPHDDVTANATLEALDAAHERVVTGLRADDLTLWPARRPGDVS